ncbi:Hypothetical protein R9X50_00433900 [Acrodontium crateriforme]|uniref:MFS maltose permease n=1 Tax=Acrodontium crateriforme TaxID=150365 RepID=A0AAQ3M7G5_9PEZI|nr:Hypothetical protein R9X50_00433900 [Acrodontium crateriforme]
MLARTLPRSRILLLRPLRPPNSQLLSTTSSCSFRQNQQLLLVGQRTSRPQLPYLSTPAFRNQDHSLYIIKGPSQQIARLLSTETKAWIKAEVYLATKWCAIGTVFLALLGIAWMGVNMERAERENPTADEWSFGSRQILRHARTIRAEGESRGHVEWAKLAVRYKTLVERCENPSIDGKDLEEQADGGLLIPNVGKAGYDISNKSWPWRACYFEAIMGAAATAEQLDGKMRDKVRNLLFSKEEVIGPSNPDPRPVPSYYATAPLEENCEPAFAPPETYYLRVLTSKGFSTEQRLDAALAYANWLEFKGLNDSAEEMYLWGVDIAKSGLDVDTSNVIDAKTSVLQADNSAAATSNLLRATTNLATHQARTGNVSSALPILLSVLRVRRNAPISQFAGIDFSSSNSEEAKTDIGQAMKIFRNIFSAPTFPPPPPSGDLPLVRSTDKPTCEESELMLYIGEILFATSPPSSEGLGWTREAVTIAEANLQQTLRQKSGDIKKLRKEMIKCKDCLSTGVNNWETMLRRVTAQQKDVTGREGGRDAGFFEWRGWFGGLGGAKGKTLDHLDAGILAEELQRVEKMKERIIREGIDAELDKVKGSSSLWVGA